MGPRFLQMLQATNASAHSTVLIQGKLTDPIELKCLVRQGYPMSPLLYLFVANALSSLLTQAANLGLIKGVFVEEIGKQITHNQYADDTTVIIEAKREGIEHLFDIFRMMGKASNLYVKESGVKATLVPDQLVPTVLGDLDWSWETPSHTSKCWDYTLGPRFCPYTWNSRLNRSSKLRW